MIKMKNALKRFLNNKRAITPVLSELLLTIIAVSAMSIATTATYVITNNMRENMSERIVVEDVWFNTSTKTIDVYLSNVGKVGTTIGGIYINHKSQPFDASFYLSLEDHQWLNVSYNWNAGELYYIDIVTSRGTHIASYYKAI
jgi:hypothetical protein